VIRGLSFLAPIAIQHVHTVSIWIMSFCSFGDQLDILRAKCVIDPFTYCADVWKGTLFELSDIDLDKSSDTCLTGCEFIFFGALWFMLPMLFFISTLLPRTLGWIWMVWRWMLGRWFWGHLRLLCWFTITFDVTACLLKLWKNAWECLCQIRLCLY
jgi:hypothetical protein